MSLTNFKIQRYYQKKPKFNFAYSKNDLRKIKDGAFITNLDEYESIGINWVALYVNGDKETYFDNFWVEYIPKEIEKYIDNKNIIKNIYRIEAYSSITCRCFCIGLLVLC